MTNIKAIFITVLALVLIAVSTPARAAGRPVMWENNRGTTIVFRTSNQALNEGYCMLLRMRVGGACTYTSGNHFKAGGARVFWRSKPVADIQAPTHAEDMEFCDIARRFMDLPGAKCVDY